jgi:hypothetical protein
MGVLFSILHLRDNGRAGWRPAPDPGAILRPDMSHNESYLWSTTL